MEISDETFTYGKRSLDGSEVLASEASVAAVAFETRMDEVSLDYVQ